MFTKFLKVARVPNVFQSALKRRRAGWSVDQCDASGRYLCQYAFWYKSEAEARAAINEFRRADRGIIKYVILDEAGE